MKRLIQLNLLLLLISSATAQESSPQQPPKTLRVYDWKDLAQEHQLSGGEVISMDGVSVLKIENTNDTPLVVSLLKITNSSVIKKLISISFDTKYTFLDRAPDWGNNIFDDSNGYGNQFPNRLELFCYLPPFAPGGDEITNAHFFAMGGTSNWKPYTVFPSTTRAMINWTLQRTLPTLLELKLYVGKGTIYLRPIKLLDVTGSWWSPQQVGLIGGIGGSVIGCFGALLGLLASKGKARNFVLTTMKIFIGLGILLTIAGFVAVVLKQPYAVWYALLLPGVILTLVFSLNLPSIQRRYDELEIRRMTSIDTMGG
jgi:hypothetical protein